MITIKTLEFNADFTSLHLNFDIDAASAGDTTELFMYVGNCYLDGENKIDLSALLVGAKTALNYDVYIPITEIYNPDLVDPIVGNCGYDKAMYDGIFTIYITDAHSAIVDEIEKAVMNAYTVSLCLAHMILEVDNVEKLNEANLLYLFPTSAAIYIEQGIISQALEAYDKALIICESAPAAYMETDIAECSKGLGCWIVNGVYLKK